MPGYGMKKKPMMKHGGKVQRKKYGHGGGAMVITISKTKNKDKKNYKKNYLVTFKLKGP